MDSISYDPTQPADETQAPARWLAADLFARVGAARFVAYAARAAMPLHQVTFIQQSRGMRTSGAAAAAVTDFGALPLIVLSRTPGRDSAWDAKQIDLLRLSSRSTQVTAANSGHNIQLDEPAAAVGAILKMVQSVR